MERIVQLRESEYKEMAELAKLNEDEVNKRAIELYNRRGLVSVEIKYFIEHSYYGGFRLNNSTDAYTPDSYDDGFKIAFADKRKIIKEVEYFSKGLIDNSLAKHLGGLNSIKEARKAVDEERLRFIVLSVVGWLLAVLLIVINAIIG